MARLTRFYQKIFASGAANNGVFGSGQDGTKVLSLDLAILQSKPAFLSGWLSAVLGSSKFPPLEEIQSLSYIKTYQLAYLFQEGIPEWETTTTYYDTSLVKKPGTFQVYRSLVNNNTGNALTDGTKWALSIDFANPSSDSTGDFKLTLKTAAPAGWIMCNDGTIGSAASGATTRANADTAALYAMIWNNVSDTYAPVSGGRGASPEADFAANKTIGITKTLGRALAVAGSGSGLTARTLGQVLGEEAHALTAAENGPHTHTATVTDPGHSHSATSYSPTPVIDGTNGSNGRYAQPPGTTGVATTGITVGITSSGSGTAHNNMQPTTFMNIMLKL
jgi:microcystin-dependent protein